MANIKQQKKRILTNELRRVRNMSFRSRMKTFIKQAEDALESKDLAKVQATLPQAISAIDRAVSKGIIHRNNAGRKKSSLQHRAAAIQA